MPTIPSPEPPPVFDDAMDEIGEFKDVAEASLGHLEDVFTVTYDENGVPARIQTGV